jgi:hypothetical protein
MGVNVKARIKVNQFKGAIYQLHNGTYQESDFIGSYCDKIDEWSYDNYASGFIQCSSDGHESGPIWALMLKLKLAKRT